jgi:hypothetical protein
MDLGEGSVLALLEGGEAGEHSGAAVGCTPDMNGDEYVDCTVGAPDVGTGTVWWVLGPVGGVVSLPDVAYVLTGDSTGDAFGARIAAGGDSNGNGRGDFYVGAPMVDGGDGAIYLFLGANL